MRKQSENLKAGSLPILLGVLFLASAVCAQGQKQAQPALQSPAGLDAQAGRSYLLGPGDVLHVKIYGQSELESTVEVDSEGNISSLPFIESPIPAQCRTEKTLQVAIATAYARLIKNPQVSVQITERKSRQPVTILGAVRTQSRVPMVRKVRLSELLTAAGGFTERAAGTIQIVHTVPLMCPAPGEETEAAPIDATNIPMEVVTISQLKTGKLQANPLVRPGDYVIVTEADPVYITGSVVSPQGVYARDQLTLSTALAMVGGVKKEAKVDEILIHRLKTGSSQRETIRVDLAAVKKNRRPDPLLQAYDWVEVPEAGALQSGRLGGTLLDVFTRGLQSIFSPGLLLP